jgi:hypothetical protein
MVIIIIIIWYLQEGNIYILKKVLTYKLRERD